MELYEGIAVKDFVERFSPYIKKGDTIYVEIDAINFGRISNGLKRNEFLEGIFQIFYQLAGDEGNIVVPTFSYSWGKEEVFDVRETKSEIGIFPEYFRQREGVMRNLDPMFSCAVYGRVRRWMTTPLPAIRSSFGEPSLYSGLHLINAKLVSFGLPQFDPTFVHYVEQYYHENIEKLDYRFIKRFEGTIINCSGSKRKDYWECFSRRRSGYPAFKFSDKKLVEALKSKRKLDEVMIGNGKVCISDCFSVFEAGTEGLQKDKHFFIEYV